MVRDCPLLRSCRCRCDHVRERQTLGRSSESARLVFPEIILNPALARLAKEPPWFPTRSRHDGDFRKFFMRVLWAIPAAQRLDEPDDLTSLLEARFNERQIHQVRKQGIRGDKHMPAGNYNPKRSFGKLDKKLPQTFPIRFGQDRETRKRIPFATVKRRRDTPDASLSPS